MEGDNAACEKRWSRLLDELLDQIIARLSLPDINSFGSACKSWRSVMLARRRLCRPPPLLVALTKQHKRPKHTRVPRSMEVEFAVSMFCLILGKLHKLSMDFPPLVLGKCESFQPSLGNSYGWSLVKNKYQFGFPLHLLNPLSGERIELPPTGRHFDVMDYVALSSSPSSGCFTLVANVSHHSSKSKLASWRRGDREWIMFSTKHSLDPFCMAFHRGKLYVVHDGGVTEVYRADGPNGPEFSGFVHDLVYKNLVYIFDDVFLVGAEELYLVVVRYEHTPFEVFKMDAGRWVQITDLGDQSLFVSHFQTHCFRTSEIMGLCIRANCVYYLDRRSHFLVYSMEDGSTEELQHLGVNLLLMPNEW